MPIQFWENKQNNIVNSNLFSSVAEEYAKKIHEEGIKNGKPKYNKPSQIRKFYDEVLRIKALLEKSPDKFKELLPYIKMLKAKAMYALGRDLITKDFKKFIDECIDQVKDLKDFEVFATFFEAFMAYYKFYRPSEGGR